MIIELLIYVIIGMGIWSLWYIDHKAKMKSRAETLKLMFEAGYEEGKKKNTQ